MGYAVSAQRRMNLPAFDPEHVRLRVAFKKLARNDTLANRIACWCTADPGDAPPFGNNSHCEVLLDVAAGCTLRIGTMRQYWRDGRWHRGSLFVLRTEEDNMRGYELLHLPASPEAARKLLRFATRNVGAPFSLLGYYTRALMPRGLGLARAWREGLEGESFTCTQLVVLLLQAASSVDTDFHPGSWIQCVRAADASAATPNDMYKSLIQSADARRTR